MKRIHSIAVLVFVAGLLAAGEAQASSYPLDQILPEAPAQLLIKNGMKTSDDLLAQAATSAARRKLAKQIKVGPVKLLEWAKLCDLVRIKGVGPGTVKLFNAVKIDSVLKLRRQKAARLMKRIEQVNAKKKITEKLPSEQHLADWIAQAKKLKIVLR